MIYRRVSCDHSLSAAVCRGNASFFVVRCLMCLLRLWSSAKILTIYDNVYEASRLWNVVNLGQNCSHEAFLKAKTSILTKYLFLVVKSYNMNKTVCSIISKKYQATYKQTVIYLLWANNSQPFGSGSECSSFNVRTQRLKDFEMHSWDVREGLG